MYIYIYMSAHAHIHAYMHMRMQFFFVGKYVHTHLHLQQVVLMEETRPLLSLPIASARVEVAAVLTLARTRANY